MKFDKNIYYDTVAYMQGGKTWITFYRKKSEAMAQRYDSGGRCHTVGLKSDGTVVAVGNNEFGQCDVGSWRDIRLPGK